MQTPRILLAEDEQAIADTLIYTLGSEGFSVRHVLLGRDVLAAQRENAFDLAILDVGLPDTTGFEVLKALRADPANSALKIVMLTAKGRETEVAKGLAIGADAYVTKPFSTKDLVVRVKELLGAA